MACCLVVWSHYFNHLLFIINKVKYIFQYISSGNWDGSNHKHIWNCFPKFRKVSKRSWNQPISWWRRQMETFSALLVICAGNSLASGEFPAQRPVTRSFDVFFDLCLNKRLRKQSWGWLFQTLLRPLWRHCNVLNNEICLYSSYQ